MLFLPEVNNGSKNQIKLYRCYLSDSYWNAIGKQKAESSPTPYVVMVLQPIGKFCNDPSYESFPSTTFLNSCLFTLVILQRSLHLSIYVVFVYSRILPAPIWRPRRRTSNRKRGIYVRFYIYGTNHVQLSYHLSVIWSCHVFVMISPILDINWNWSDNNPYQTKHNIRDG